jgi:hypothetical protein
LLLSAVGALVDSVRPRAGGQANRLPPSQRLDETFMAVLCRPPSSAETLEWDTKTFSVPDLSMSLQTTAEGVRVRDLRRVYLEVLRRDPFTGDCTGLRSWVDRGTSVADVARRLARTREAARVGEVRAALARGQGRDPAGWDNGTIRRWAETGFTPEEIERRAASQRPRVAVHYFAWYQSVKGQWGNGVTAAPSTAPEPTLGWYDSRDPSIMDAHIAQMERVGFDIVILQIVADLPSSWATAQRFFERLSGRRLQVVVMLDGLYTPAIAAATGTILRAVRTFGGHPNYVRVRGQPLVLLYSGRLDFPVPGVQLRNVYWADAYGPGENSYNPDRHLYPRDWAFWAPTPPPLVNGIVPVTPGYSDTHLERGVGMEHPRDDGAMYREQWRQALSLRPELVIVYSWNEHFEQTAIEPTAAWGDRYLQLTQCFIALAHAGREGTC